MKVFRLRSHTDFQGELIKIKDGNKRISDYFVLNQGSDKFLSFSVARGSADTPYTPMALANEDFLEASPQIPIFSERARTVLELAIADEIEFHPILIEIDGKEIKFHLAKSKIYCALIDEDRSTFMSLPGVKPLLQKEVYFPEFELDFWIARDKKYPNRTVVSERFVDLCNDKNLKIDFKELAQ